MLMTHLPDESDPRLFMNCTLTILERISDGIPAEPFARRRDWDRLVERYAALYEQWDPDMESPDIERGEALGKSLLNAIG
ncbi:hypothetical protein DQK91_22805 [Oceanidesulfovibrio marinus]|uniref:Uncharacterized protein n=1 Tax=Oceanidesulfovibrio marinus TaxID=370038 RepID=A0A6P1ZBB1_9BACT|nr:hypothetical protein DQK91_22805 [Oceanidesulfovibrio marinus]